MNTPHHWIGVDLDGTLAFYDEWRGILHIGEPIPSMLERVKTWIADGQRVKILTARVGPQLNQTTAELREIISTIQEWSIRHIGQVLEVTCQKDFQMRELWDDRCIQVIPNTGERADRCTALNPAKEAAYWEAYGPSITCPSLENESFVGPTDSNPDTNGPLCIVGGNTPELSLQNAQRIAHLLNTYGLNNP